MRAEPNMALERYRVNLPGFAASPGRNHGCFFVTVGKAELKVISSGSGMDAVGLPASATRSARDWEHVSVSLEDRTPTWEEMEFVKDLFWAGHETVVQFHPAKGAKINYHPHCLHLWKRRGVDVELPHPMLIGPVGG